MVYKVKISSLFSLCLVITMASFFGLYNYINSGVYVTDQQAIFIIVLCSVFLLYYSLKKSKLIKIDLQYKTSLFLYLIMISTAIIVARYRYDQNWYYTLKEAMYYIAALMMVPTLCYVYRDKSSIDKLKKYIVYAAMLCAIVSFLEYFFLQRGIDLLRLNTYIQERNGSRYEIGTIVIVFSILISVSNIITYKLKNVDRIYIINILLQSLNLVFIVKTRSLMFYLLLSALIAVLLSKNTSHMMKALLWIGIISCSAYLISSNFINAFGEFLNGDVGIAHRFLTIEYYMNQFKTYPFTGTGFISGNKNLSTAIILRGPYGNHNRSDVGIVGLLNEFGIIGLIWVLFFIVITFKKICKWKNEIDDCHYIFLLMFTIYISVTCVNLILTDTFRFMYMPLLLFFVSSSDFYRREMK